jgi:hypothetical protein
LEGLNKDGGINFERKRNFSVKEKEPEMFSRKAPDEEPEEEIIEEPVVLLDPISAARQARLEAKLKTAKTINYSGFAVNGTSVITLLFGMNAIISDPNTLSLLNSINDMFGLDIDFELILSNIEAFKMQLIGLFVSVQTMLMGYKDTCQKMKDRDTESFMEVINQEMDKM